MSRTELCIARHGETDWNIAGILQGWLDVELNDVGRRQAVEMARALAAERFARVCSSPLKRSLETAEIIAREWNLEAPCRHDGLKERNFGAIQGTPKAELAELNPLLLQQIMIRNPAAEFELGESMDEFADRVLDAAIEIGAAHPDERVLVITHGWVLDVFTRHVRGLGRRTILNHKPKNGDTLWVVVEGEEIAAR